MMAFALLVGAAGGTRCDVVIPTLPVSTTKIDSDVCDEGGCFEGRERVCTERGRIDLLIPCVTWSKA